MLVNKLTHDSTPRVSLSISKASLFFKGEREDFFFRQKKILTCKMRSDEKRWRKQDEINFKKGHFSFISFGKKTSCDSCSI